MSTIHDTSGNDEEPQVEALDSDRQADDVATDERTVPDDPAPSPAAARRFYANLADL